MGQGCHIQRSINCDPVPHPQHTVKVTNCQMSDSTMLHVTVQLS